MWFPVGDHFFVAKICEICLNRVATEGVEIYVRRDDFPTEIDYDNYCFVNPDDMTFSMQFPPGEYKVLLRT